MIHLASPSYSLRGMVAMNQQSCDKRMLNPNGLMTNPLNAEQLARPNANSDKISLLTSRVRGTLRSLLDRKSVV